MAILTYTGLRLLLLVSVIGLFYSFGMRGLLLLISGFLVSALLSFYLLSAPRAAMSSKVSGYFRKVNNRIDEAARAEDGEPSRPAAAARDSDDPGDTSTR